MLIAITTDFKNSFKAMDHKLLLGIGWKILSCGCFAAINIIVRYLSSAKFDSIQQLPSLVIIFFQNIIGTAVLLPFIVKEQLYLTKLILPDNLGLQVIRIIIATIGLLLWYLSLGNIPVTEVVAISFISPVLTVLGAIIFLKEQLNIKKFTAILLSIIGSFLITRPDLAVTNKSINLINILPISAALMFALDKLITTRILKMNQCPMLTTMYVLIFTAILCLILALVTDCWVTPTYTTLILLSILGLLSALAHFAFHKSIMSTEISNIMPYGISKIIFSMIFSYWMFKEIPTTISLWTGIIIMTFSTILLI